MAEIPADIASSAAQAGYQARAVEGERAARRTSRRSATERQIKAVDEADTTVETDDADSRVYTNAEGSGSQGRPFDDSATETDEPETDAPQDGIVTDDDGHMHLDVQA